MIILKYIYNKHKSMIFRKIFNRFSTDGKYFKDTKYMNFNITAPNRVGSLHAITRTFAENKINLSHIRTHHGNKKKGEIQQYTMSVSVDKIQPHLFQKLKEQFSWFNIVVEESPALVVPWFPRYKKDLDKIGHILLQPADEVNNDHPQFTDPQYRQRRDFIAKVAKQYKIGDKIPEIPYSEQQTQLWCNIFKKLYPLQKRAMSHRFLFQMDRLQQNFKISQRIPQLDQLNDYLKAQTNFQIKPTHGILSQRQFLNAFAFRTFCCTQYLRHHKTPDYVPQPDIVHEILGHVPMFADPDVAQLSHRIGLLSLGASDQQIANLGSLYWFTLQFGVCKQANQMLGYGAGVASSIGQIQHFLSGKANFKKFQPMIDAGAPYPVQTVQELYRVTESFEGALEDLEEYGKYIMKPVTTHYNFDTEEIQYDRHIEAVFTEDKGPKF